ncbi:MAG: universal stress protein [Sphingobacteriales bacterium]|nr:universal stress protein [Sphingobacteriales bacterium]OJY87970.1 MAG: hypothetical protein BGP14_21220 [Sphingobacteriales bacterium 44-15]
MKKILAAVDFSEPSVNAARYAFDLVKQTPGASLTLYYVYERITAGSDGTPLLVDTEARRTVAMTALQNLISELGTALGVTINAVAEEGSLATSLEKYVQHLGIDLVVMGITGSTRLEQIIIGSNTLNVIAKEGFPVLIVPMGAAYKKINTVAFSTDLKDVAASTPLQTLKAFLDFFNAGLYVVHVETEYNVIPPAAQKEKEKLEDMLKAFDPRYFFILEEDFANAMEKFTEEYHPDIFITVPRRHSFLSRLFKERFTKKLAYNSPVPILAIHAKGE